MGRDVDLHFSFSRRQSWHDLIRALVEGGWRIDDQGVIRYLIDPDMFEWTTVGLGEADRVVADLESARISSGSCAVILTWRDTGVGGAFLVDSFGEGVTFDPVRNVVNRSDFNTLVDFEWYLARIVPLLASLGLDGLKMSDVPS